MATLSNDPRLAMLLLAVLFGGVPSGVVLAAADEKPPSQKDGATAGDNALRSKVLTLNSVNGNGPMAGKILELVKDPAAAKDLIAEARRVVKESGRPLNVNATYILAQTAHALRDYDSAVVFFRANADLAVKLQSGSKVFAAYQGLTVSLSRARRYAECEKACREFLTLDLDDTVEKAKPILMRRGVLAQALLGQYDKALNTIEKELKENPDNFLNLEVKAQLLREAGKSEESLKVYEEALDRIKNEKRLTDEKVRESFIDGIRYALSGVYVDLNQLDKAAGELEALLKKDPNNATFNNDLGYIWADHDMKLEESEKLIRKALQDDRKQRRKAKDDPETLPEEDKDNPAYLDSLGWVLFKQRKYKEAKAELVKAAAEEEGKHVEIYDHLARTHLALGEKAEAVAVWKKALKLPTVSKRDQQRKDEIEKQLKTNQ